MSAKPLILVNAPLRPDMLPAVALLFWLDDLLAQEFLLRAGVVLPEPERRPGGNMVVGLFSLHPTHWIIGARFIGYSQPQQNGYLAIAEPKAYATEAEARARMHEVWASTKAIPYRFVEMPGHPPRS